MPDHVHLVLVPAVTDGLRATLGETHRRYTCHINRRRGWRGHLWEERFHSFVMDEHYTLAAACRMEREPVDACLCSRLEQWRWSSALAHLRGDDDGLVRTTPLGGLVDSWAEFLAAAPGAEACALITLHSRTGRPLGSQEFLCGLERSTGRTLLPRRRGRKPRSAGVAVAANRAESALPGAGALLGSDCP